MKSLENLFLDIQSNFMLQLAQTENIYNRVSFLFILKRQGDYNAISELYA